MPIPRPDSLQVQAIASSLGMTMSLEEARDYRSLMEESFDAYDVIDALPDFVPTVHYPRTPGYRPDAAENELGAWARKSVVTGAREGKLAGRTVALKDNIALAGVPMMNGASTLEGFVPVSDATIVTRMLDAGATIMGKAVCEHFCLSGSSHTSDPAPVHNPLKMGYSAGGSSSGSAALVAAGEIDMAIGGDQGGSIRIPSSFCGIYGMKPTHGLVPYTGVMPIEATIDHVGPMTATVSDNALLLEVIAGADGLDPRQYAPRLGGYRDAIDKGVTGLKIGVIAEAFALPELDVGVSAKVRAGADRLRALGAQVEDITLPAFLLAGTVWKPIAWEGSMQQMMHGNGMGFNWKGAYDVGLVDAHAGWRNRADELSAPLKMSMIIGQWGLTRYRGRYYAKAQNIARSIRQSFSAAFAHYDLLLSPTLPCVATRLPDRNASLAEVIARASEVTAFTSPMDVTGNPSMSVPCGMIDGLPVGLMLTAKDWDEATIYQAAAAFEASFDWRKA